MNQTLITRIRTVMLAAICIIGSFVLFECRREIKDPAAPLNPGELSLGQGVRPAVAASPSLRDDAALLHLKQEGSLTSLAAAVAAATYSFDRVNKKSGPPNAAAYEAINTSQSIRATFTGLGLQVKSTGVHRWQMGLQLKGYGYGKQVRSVESGQLKTQGSRLEISKHTIGRSRTSSLTEWYENKQTGLEQGFTLFSQPVTDARQGALAHKRLRLRLSLTGNLRGEVTGEGRAMRLQDRQGHQAASYGQLKAFDAAGRELEARMRVRRRQLSLEVDDTGATYPISIDPFLTQEVKLKDDSGAALDKFGWTVAISGNTAIVGNVFSGNAYIFVRNGSTWSLQQKLATLPSTTAVAISGNTAIVGAAANGNGRGAVYVFLRTGTTWSQQQILIPSDGVADDRFGSSVAISGDTVVVGAPYKDHDRGAAYVFVRSGATWSAPEQARLLAISPEDLDGFGWSVGISGDTVIVGAYNDSVAGETIHNKGSAYIFVRTGTAWHFQSFLTAPSDAPGWSFGWSVAISGNNAVVGSEVGDSAYVFTRSGTMWSLPMQLLPNPGEAVAGDGFGLSVAISGNRAVVGASKSDLDRGAAYVFERNGPGWAEVEKLTASDAPDPNPTPPGGDGLADSSLGYSVAISGTTEIAGAPYRKVGVNQLQGQTYVFQSPDTDGDGLPDSWEMNGITVDADGQISVGNTGNGVFIDLPAMGADPMHKDLFIHADWMQPDTSRTPTVIFKPQPRAIKMVIDAFAAVPNDLVNNPDHKPGISLHVDLGSASIMNPRTGASWGTLSKAGDVPFQASTGFFDDAPNFSFYNWSAVDAIKQVHFAPAKRSAVFHYALFANHYSPDSSSGISRGIPAADFIVTLGDWPTPGGTVAQQAGTFMHEFGHNIGLLHGGGDNLNNKPNYLSIMNYSFQMIGLLNANGKRSLDYSRRQLNTLDENNNLIESVGINDPDRHGTLWKTTRPDNPPGSNKCVGPANVNIYYRRFFPPALDWNCDGLQTAGAVPADINGDRTTSLLVGFKDWPALVFDGGGKIGSAAGAGESDQVSSPNDEATMAQVLAVVPPALFDEELVAPLDVVTISPQTGAGPLVVNFNGGASTAVNGTIVNWSWEFGDGTTGAGATVTHTYATPGDYYASLNVTDSNGHVNLVPLLNLVTVTDGPVPTPTPTPTATPTPSGTPMPNLTPYQPAGWSDKLVVSKVTGTNTDNAPLLTTDSLYVDFSVTNNGNAATPASFGIKLYVDGLLVHSFAVGQLLNPNAFVFLEDFSLGSLGAGQHAIKIVADANGEIGESDETDNEYTKLITISPASPPPTPTPTATPTATPSPTPTATPSPTPTATPSPTPTPTPTPTPGPGDVDPIFTASATYNSQSVYKVITQPDGKIIVGGFFESFAGGTRLSVARVNADGSCDLTFDPKLALPNAAADASVGALALQSDGKVLIGISYSRADFNAGQNPNRKGIIRLNADGTLDSSFNAGGLDVSSSGVGVQGIVLQADGKILISGSFLYNAGTRDNFARLNPDGSVDTSFNVPSPSFTVTHGVSGAGSAIALVQSDGKILIGGFFQLGASSDPNVPKNLVRLNSDGSLDANFNAHAILFDPNYRADFPDLEIEAIALQPDGKIIASLQHLDGTAPYRMVRINSDGTRDLSFTDAFAAANVSPTYTRVVPRRLVLQPDGKVIVSGDFNLSAPAARIHVARLNTDGTLDTSFDVGLSGVGSNGGQTVNDVVRQTNGKVVLVGEQIDNLKGAPAEDILQLNPDGSRDPLFDSNGPGLNGEVEAVVRQPDGKLLVGYRSISLAYITKLNASRLNGIGRINVDGTTDPTFSSPCDPGSRVYQIVLQPDGKILIGGNCKVTGSQNILSFARLNSNGTIDSTFVPPLFSAGAGVIQPDGKIFAYVAGNLERLNPDGSRDNTFADVTFDSSPSTILLQPDGRILLGGQFTSIGRNAHNVARNNVARLNADGSVDATFDPGAGTGGNAFLTTVRSVILQPDGKIFIGGDFTSFNGTARDRLARLNSDGSLDTLFVPVNPDARLLSVGVGALALQSDGKVVVESPLNLSGQAFSRIFRLSTDGSPDASFTLGTVAGGNARVNAILIQPDNNILIGGEFSIVNGVARLALARLLGSSTPTSTPTPTPTPTATPTPAPTPTPRTVQFSASNYDVIEDCTTVQLTVTRTGDTSGALTVDFTTSDGSAIQRTDYTLGAGTLTFATGQTSKSFTLLITEDHYVEGAEQFNVTLSNPAGGTLGNPNVATVTINDDDTAQTLSPSPKVFAGTLNGAQETPANSSSARGIALVELSDDETTAKVSMSFSGLSASETAAYIDGPGARGVSAPALFSLPLGSFNNFQTNLTSSQVASLKAGLLSVNVHNSSFPDGEIRAQLEFNPIDDATLFVGQAYHDFLSRQSDSSGQTYWSGQITQCGNDAACVRDKRVDVSNAFFYELEYQQTGAYVFRLYRAAFGNNQPFPNPDNSNQSEAKKLPSYGPFAYDRARVTGGADLATGQQSLADAFVQRKEFLTKYPMSLDGPAFVDAVIATIKIELGADLTSQRTPLINLYNSSGRGAVIYRLADDNVITNPINNRDFIDAEYNRAFVFSQYSGYLRRDADIGGFLFWTGQINSAPLRDVTKQHAMVCSFITSAEYQQRFSPVVTKSNGECSR